jgi:glycosyltransferase involved in cell wall biosynthesis
MNNTPVISLIMPVYNSEIFLEEAIKSILNQSFKNFEFIIIYDDSSDNTLSIIQNFQKQDDRIKIIYGDKDGISGALNKGIEKSEGKYIARMDSDDISLPNRFEIQISHMEKFGLDICGGHSLLIDTEGRINGLGGVPRSHELCALSMMFMVPFAHSSVMMARDFLINKSLRYQGKYEDFDMWIRMFSDGAKFGNVDEVIIRYRVLKESLSTVHAIGSRRDTRRVLRTFRAENKKYLKNLIDCLDISLLSDNEKSLVARYLINRAITRLDFINLNKLKNINFKTIILMILSEFQRLLTKYAWWNFFKSTRDRI